MRLFGPCPVWLASSGFGQTPSILTCKASESGSAETAVDASKSTYFPFISFLCEVEQEAGETKPKT